MYSFTIRRYIWLLLTPFACVPDATQVERYGPYTDRISAVISGAEIRTVFSRYTAPYTIPYYCAQDYGIIRLICGRKIAVFLSFSVRKRPVNDAVLIELGTRGLFEDDLRQFEDMPSHSIIGACF